MKKITNFTREEKYTCDAVINRGYAIYDEWLEKKSSSRKIVDSVNNAVRVVKENKTKAASVEALAYLFALDMRIKERYKSILYCIFRYFSWRRETNALKQLKGIFYISKSDDIRTAIEVELQNIRENINAEESDDADDEIHGGKKNGMTEEKNIGSENKQQEQTADEISEDSAETEELEATEEDTEEIDSDSVAEEQIEEQVIESDEKQQNVSDESVSQTDELAQNLNEEEQAVQNENYLENENNSSLENKSKPLENNNYIDAVDSFFFESEQKSEKKEKISSIEQIIMDDIINERKDYVTHNTLEDDNPTKDDNQIHIDDSLKNEKTKDATKDAYLYDSALKSDNVVEQMQNVNVSQLNGEQTKVDAQKTDLPMDTKDKTDLRMPIQIDIDNDLENEYRKEIDRAMTPEMVEAMVKRMAEEGREQMKIAFADLGMDDPIEMVGFDDLNEVKETTIVADRK